MLFGLFGNKKSSMRAKNNAVVASVPESMLRRTPAPVEEFPSEVYCMTSYGHSIRLIDPQGTGAKKVSSDSYQIKSMAIKAYKAGHKVTYLVDGRKQNLERLAQDVDPCRVCRIV